MRIGVDARPLTVPTFGIGRYTQCLLDIMVKEADIDWYLYADRPIIYDISGKNIIRREYRNHQRLLSLYRTQMPFSQWAKDDKLDLFWSPRHHLPLMMDSSIKTVVTIHDLVWQKFPETMLRENLFIERLLMPPSLKKADAIISVSASTKNDLVEAYSFTEPKISVIHEAVPKTKQAEKRLLNEPYFLCVGTLEPRKNIVNSIAAFQQYRAEGGDRHLVIVGGKGWKLKDIASKSINYNDQDVIHIVGRVNDEDLMSYYRFADVFIFPSLYEGFGLPPLEAMQYAVPVIASNCSSLPEVIGEGGLFVNPLSIDEICNAMMTLSKNQTLRQELGKKALAQSRKFSWEKAASETLRLFAAI
ncbi:MAG: glycosyltransferase involved in cell wall biosynthesis [Flavobacterium sp.]|jgi:glycosyltransferase involved in cell wall biosynthesis